MSRFAKEDDVAGLMFAEIAAKHGEEAAVEVGMAAEDAITLIGHLERAIPT